MGNDRFIELVGKKLSNEITSDETLELQHCLDADDSLRQQYNFLVTYWKNNDTEYADNALAFQKIKTKIKVQQADAVTEETLPSRKIFYLLRIAAAILLVTGCSYFFYSRLLKPNNEVLSVAQNNWYNKTTQKREKSTITLTDGTRITLNSQSSLKFPANFSGKTREVYLSGEAYFDVHKDHEHPFIIHTEKMNIKVLGTSFNVRSYPNDPSSETTLIRGAIEVTLDDRPSDRIILKPSEKLIVKNGAFKTIRKTPGKLAPAENPVSTQYVLTSLTRLHPNDETVVETSWVQNKLVFRDENFNDLSNRLERWYGVDIRFKNDDLKQYRFTGIFEKETINQALDALRMTEDFHYKVKSSTIYIY